MRSRLPLRRRRLRRGPLLAADPPPRRRARPSPCCARCARVARHGVVVNDLRRGLLPLAVTAATVLAPRAHPRHPHRRHQRRRAAPTPSRARRAARRRRAARPLALAAMDAARRDGRRRRDDARPTSSSWAPGRPARRRRPAWRARARASCSSRRPITHAPRRAPSTPARGSSRSWRASAWRPTAWQTAGGPADRHGDACRRQRGADQLRRRARTRATRGASTAAPSTRPLAAHAADVRRGAARGNPGRRPDPPRRLA